MGKLRDLTNQKFGRLTVKGYHCGAVRGKHGVKWDCECECGNTKTVGAQALTSGKTVSCGCYWRERMRGPNSPVWSTDAHKTVTGYVVLANADYPGATFPNQTKEHIVVMSRHLGRRLFADESVHHKNGIRDDNRIENLELRASGHGKGQTIGDLVAWAKEIHRRYTTENWTHDNFHQG